VVTTVALVALLTSAALPSAARAVGLEGDAASARRVGAGVGLGWDQVAGVGRDAYPFVELYGHGELRLRDHLALGAALGLRRDLANYNFALGRWRGGSTGIDAQLTIGYDGARFHLSLGPAMVAHDRWEGGFQVGLLPLGTVRLRIGSQEGWNVGVRLIESVPGSAGGGSVGARLDLGLPPSSHAGSPTFGHRVRAGLYTSAAEGTAGLSISDEFPIDVFGGAGAGFTWRRARTLRLACLLGADRGHLRRGEVTCAAELIF
jgi:hypothetical protein